MDKKRELLSPAGSYSILKAVANAGADAVYAAGNKFGARAYAENFTEKELLEALDYLHLKEKRFYLTVNTLLKEQEVSELYEYLLPLYQEGLDAVIVQDIGVMHFIKQNFPNLPIHASTQMTITGEYGARLLLEAGCSRIVTARELSFQEISNIYQKTGAEIESFVHGALCYCYSGQCLLSSMIGGRSGNRGRCAQPCRLPYELYENKEKAVSSRKHKEQYPLSLKDLCTIDLIPQLIQSGVYSFKIEGRMKQAAYAAGVTSIYRKYIDQYEANPEKPYSVSKEDRETLLHLGNRCGFTDGYYTRHNGKEMITFLKPSHEKGKDFLQEQIYNTYIQIEKKEKINGILKLFIGNPAILVIRYKDIQIEINGQIVQSALKQPLSQESIIEKMKKTGNTSFVFDTLEVEMEQEIFLPASALNQLRRDALYQLENKMLEKYKRKNAFRFHKEAELQKEKTEKLSEKIETEGLEKVTFPKDLESEKLKTAKLSREPELRVLTETLEQFQVVLRQPEVGRIYLEAFSCIRKELAQHITDCVEQAHKMGKECYLAMPYIFRMETAQWFCNHWKKILQTGVDGYLIRNFEELQFLKEMGVKPESIQGDYNIYIHSKEAIQGFAQFSCDQFTLPVELNFRELKYLDCTKSEIILYGYQPLISSQCIHKNMKGCDKKSDISYLKDRYGKLFPVKNRCEDCYNMIYNTHPLFLLHHLKEIRTLQTAGIRFSFTIENKWEIEQVFNSYREVICLNISKQNINQRKCKTYNRETNVSNKEKQGQYPKEYTNGHFKRGVE